MNFLLYCGSTLSFADVALWCLNKQQNQEGSCPASDQKLSENTGNTGRSLHSSPFYPEDVLRSSLCDVISYLEERNILVSDASRAQNRSCTNRQCESFLHWCPLTQTCLCPGTFLLNYPFLILSIETLSFSFVCFLFVSLISF